jgi:NDP-sugar pyrophosphorylase family protein
MANWTRDRPKALIAVCGVPFADHQLAALADQGITRVLYSIGYLGDMIRDHVGDGADWGLTVDYIDEGPRLLGTAGALRLAADHDALDDDFFVMYGDSYLTVDFREVAAAHAIAGMPALMVVHHNDGRWDRSNVVFRDGRVVLYDKHRSNPPEDMGYIDYGLSILSQRVIVDAVPSGQIADLAEVFHLLSLAGRLAGHRAEERFYEIGSPEGLRALEELLSARTART